MVICPYTLFVGRTLREPQGVTQEVGRALPGRGRIVIRPYEVSVVRVLVYALPGPSTASGRERSDRLGCHQPPVLYCCATVHHYF